MLLLMTYWYVGKFSQHLVVLLSKEMHLGKLSLYSFVQFYSDTAYRTRIQLAVLDHNAHMDHNAKQHGKSLDYQYHRRYRKQTKNWDAVKVMEAKEYKYIANLIEQILPL